MIGTLALGTLWGGGLGFFAGCIMGGSWALFWLKLADDADKDSNPISFLAAIVGLLGGFGILASSWTAGMWVGGSSAFMADYMKYQ
jgi:hypothetical protein